MIVLLKDKATQDDVEKAREEFGDYFKIVIDIKNEKVAIGGKLHADAEKILLEKGSEQSNIWGGGMKVNSKELDSQAVINIRPNQGNSNMEILDTTTRNKFLEIAGRVLK